MNEGLTTTLVLCENGTDLDEEEEILSNDLPPDFALVRSIGSDPKTLDEVLHGPDAKHWQEALEYEIGQLEKLETWDIIDLPQGHTEIPCSEVIKVKCSPNGETLSYWVRIIAGGHRQVKGINYTETFSAAAKMPTVQVILANAAHQDWEIDHIDMKSAYLNAKLKETIYMKPPRGVLKKGQEGKVLKLKKGLYGLKQAGRGWYQEMSRVFVEKMGFSRSSIDHSVFYQRKGEEHTIVAVAMDDMAVTSKQRIDAERFKMEIKGFWVITDHGPIKWFLGFQIKQNREAGTLLINQKAYIEAMVEKFGLIDAKLVSTPMEVNTQYSIQQSPSTLKQTAQMLKVPYSKAIGSVLWPVVISWPDMVYTIGILSQFIQNLGPVHWEALKRVISYLGTTKDHWLTFGGKEKGEIQGYCDADWASQHHWHSISGFLFHFGEGAVSWSSKKQAVIALLSTEAEYISQTHAAKEAAWLRNFIVELQGKPQGLLTVLCDNQGAIALSKDNKFHSRMKHIDLRYHFIREAIDEGKINVEYIPTAENITDVFTKALARLKFEVFIEMLGLGGIKEERKNKESRLKA